MNKVFTINLGGLPFTIDEDAFVHLDQYLKAIHQHFQKSEGYEEILSDIEYRIAELFQEGLGSRKIVTIRDVRSAIGVMGTPEEFGAEPMSEQDKGRVYDHTSSGPESKYRPGRRLYRNPDDEIIGGVCSGISAYIGIEDPLWVRLVFVLITISGGFGILGYLILWAILPKADTASDRLAMRGEPINVSNIGKIIEEGIDNLSKKVNEMGDDLDGKWGSKKKVLTQTPIEHPKESEMALPRGYL